MTAAAFSAAQARTQGLRPVDARRDMARLAELIQQAFGSELDSLGRQMVRDMRALGRLGWIGWLVSRLVLPPAGYPRGFVWEQDGQLVGNASLLGVTGHRDRWVLANVAVHPDYRRRGIARELVQAAIALTRSYGASRLMLQVKPDNPAALMYAAMGFRSLRTRTTWLRQRSAAGPAQQLDPAVRARRERDWRDQWELAQDVSPEGLVWPYPLTPRTFRPEPLLSALKLTGGRHWVRYEGSMLAGSLTVRPMTEAGAQRLILLAHPEWTGLVEPALIAQAMASQAAQRVSLVLDYPVGIATEFLQAAGFRPQRTLTWMELLLS